MNLAEALRLVLIGLIALALAACLRQYRRYRWEARDFYRP